MDTDEEMDDQTVLNQLTEHRRHRHGVTADRNTRHDAAEQAKPDYPTDLAYAPRMRQLYERLQSRGQEALLPRSWRLDFQLLPEALFFADDATASRYAPIRSVAGTTSSETRGKFAFEKLLTLGKVVRARHDLAASQVADSIQGSTRPDDATIIDSVRAFARWASRDAKLDKEMSRFLICCQGSATPLGRERSVRRRKQRRRGCESTGEDDAVLAQLGAEVERRLRDLAAVHREAGHRYVAAHTNGGGGGGGAGKGVVLDDEAAASAAQALAGSVYCIAADEQKIAVVALACRDPSAPLRALETSDLRDGGRDLWTLLAVALAVMAARDECLDSRRLALPTDDDDLLARFESLRVQDGAGSEDDDVDR